MRWWQPPAMRFLNVATLVIWQFSLPSIEAIKANSLHGQHEEATARGTELLQQSLSSTFLSVQNQAEELSVPVPKDAADMMSTISSLISLISVSSVEGSGSLQKEKIAALVQSMETHMKSLHATKQKELSEAWRSHKAQDCVATYKRKIRRSDKVRNSLQNRSQRIASCKDYLQSNYSSLLIDAKLRLQPLHYDMHQLCQGKKSSPIVSLELSQSCDDRSSDSVGEYFEDQLALMEGLMQFPQESGADSETCAEATLAYQKQLRFYQNAKKQREHLRWQCSNLQERMDIDACEQSKERREVCDELEDCVLDSREYANWISTRTKICGNAGTRDHLGRQSYGMAKMKCLLAAAETVDKEEFKKKTAQCLAQSRTVAQMINYEFEECQYFQYEKVHGCDQASTPEDEDMSGTAAYEQKYYNSFQATTCTSSCCTSSSRPDPHQPNAVLIHLPKNRRAKFREIKGYNTRLTGLTRLGATKKRKKSHSSSKSESESESESDSESDASSDAEADSSAEASADSSADASADADAEADADADNGCHFSMLFEGHKCGPGSGTLFNLAGPEQSHLECEASCQKVHGCNVIVWSVHETEKITRCAGYKRCKNVRLETENFITQGFQKFCPGRKPKQSKTGPRSSNGYSAGGATGGISINGVQVGGGGSIPGLGNGIVIINGGGVPGGAATGNFMAAGRSVTSGGSSRGSSGGSSRGSSSAARSPPKRSARLGTPGSVKFVNHVVNASDNSSMALAKVDDPCPTGTIKIRFKVLAEGWCGENEYNKGFSYYRELSAEDRRDASGAKFVYTKDGEAAARAWKDWYKRHGERSNGMYDGVEGGGFKDDWDWPESLALSLEGARVSSDGQLDANRAAPHIVVRKGKWVAFLPSLDTSRSSCHEQAAALSEHIQQGDTLMLKKCQAIIPEEVLLASETQTAESTTADTMARAIQLRLASKLRRHSQHNNGIYGFDNLPVEQAKAVPKDKGGATSASLFRRAADKRREAAAAAVAAGIAASKKNKQHMSKAPVRKCTSPTKIDFEVMQRGECSGNAENQGYSYYQFLKATDASNKDLKARGWDQLLQNMALEGDASGTFGGPVKPRIVHRNGNWVMYIKSKDNRKEACKNQQRFLKVRMPPGRHLVLHACQEPKTEKVLALTSLALLQQSTLAQYEGYTVTSEHPTAQLEIV
eukprot:TRINITY_DN1510_c0_g1_i1.p1 TRINITY_DN1510_c0_g1~~TRINITY_DN1510_c0_g1_i1.p1  ORF type:complete len:1177 (-),score=290.86 TRINITY_DN1510_c0_g1_i1:85-3615(-)